MNDEQTVTLKISTGQLRQIMDAARLIHSAANHANEGLDEAQPHTAIPNRLCAMGTAFMSSCQAAGLDPRAFFEAIVSHAEAGGFQINRTLN